jgi:RNA polymerase sigma-70 factor, ECF subfamily
MIVFPFDVAFRLDRPYSRIGKSLKEEMVTLLRGTLGLQTVPCITMDAGGRVPDDSRRPDSIRLISSPGPAGGASRMTRDGLADPTELIARARRGDESAVGQLLEISRNYLKLLARLQIDRQLQGKADASDLVQDTFMEAVRDFPAFRGVSEAEWLAWLRRILASNLANLVRHYRGTRRRDVRLERTLAADVDHSSESLEMALVAKRQNAPWEEAARREQSVVLADLLERLPPDYREAIVLRQLEGYTFPEVAVRMGRTVDSVKKLWVRGLTKLRETLEDRS